MKKTVIKSIDFITVFNINKMLQPAVREGYTF